MYILILSELEFEREYNLSKEPLRMELLDFVDRVMSGTEPAANGPAACRTIWIAETVIAQAGKQPTFR